MVIALLALFVALDGPATAARLIDGGSLRRNSVTSRQIRNRTIGTQDLSRAATRSLKATPAGSVGPQQLADGAVGPRVLAPKAVDGTKLGDSSVGPMQLAPDAVTSSRIADGAVGGAAVGDGTLQTTDVGDFFGSVSIDFKSFDSANTCQTAIATPTPTGNPDAMINDDVIMVTPAQAGFSDFLTLSAYPGTNNSLRIVACRVYDGSATVIDPPPMRFFYLGIDAP